MSQHLPFVAAHESTMYACVCVCVCFFVFWGKMNLLLLYKPDRRAFVRACVLGCVGVRLC